MTRSPFTALLALVTFLLPLALLSGSADAAQGLVQVRLSGAVTAAAAESDDVVPDDVVPDDGTAADRFHGHLVEIEVDAHGRDPLGQDQDAKLVLHVHIAHGTTGLEILQLVHSRLERLGVDSTLTEESGVLVPGASPAAASLWVEAATRVHLRLGGGLLGEVSCVEGPPTAIRLLPASAIPGPASVAIAASTALVMPGRRPIRGRATFSAKITDAENSAEAATALWTSATNRWVSERPGSDTWRPIKMASGATITGVSVRVAGRSDWGLEVSL